MNDEILEADFQIGELHLTGSFEVSGEHTSRFTGRSLRTAVLSVPAEDFEEAQETSRVAREGAPAVDAEGASWDVTSASMTSASDGQPQSELLLVEHENLVADRVEFPTLDLTPTRYSEQAYGGALLIEILTEALDGASRQALEELLDNSHVHEEPQYFNIHRRGVAEEPLSVRFGRVLWQDNPEGPSYLVVLVSEEGDGPELQKGAPQPHDPQLQRLVDHETHTLARLDRIEQALVRAGLLDESETGPFLDENSPAWARARRRFTRTRRLDEFF